MARYRDNAPVGHTCPLIDGIISRMESAVNEAEYIYKNTEDEDAKDGSDSIIHELSFAIKEIEDIRSANSELRDWGNELHNRVEGLEEDIDDAIRDKEYLQEEIDDLKAKIEELEAELGDVDIKL